MRSALFVSLNFLERVAEPESPFHPVYLTYREGEITRAELIARLRHVAMLGDSACIGIYISWDGGLETAAPWQQIAALFQVRDCFPHHATAEMSLSHA